MKFLSLATLFTLLFSSAVVAQVVDESANENAADQDQTAQERQIRRDQEQQPAYNAGEYDARYDEGVRRDKQALEEEEALKKEQEAKNKKDEKEEDSEEMKE